LFEGCEIRTGAASGGSIVQNAYIPPVATPDPPWPAGIIFLDSTFTAAQDLPADSIYLGRTGATLNNMVFSRCTLGSHISSSGYSGTSTTTPSPVVGQRYYGLVTPTGDPWSTSSLAGDYFRLTLEANEALYASRDKIFTSPVSYNDGTTTYQYTTTTWALSTTY
jgi:hypothetical protein